VRKGKGWDEDKREKRVGTEIMPVTTNIKKKEKLPWIKKAEREERSVKRDEKMGKFERDEAGGPRNFEPGARGKG